MLTAKMNNPEQYNGKQVNVLPIGKPECRVTIQDAHEGYFRGYLGNNLVKFDWSQVVSFIPDPIPFWL